MWLSKMRNLFRRDRIEREMEDGLRFHLEMQIEENGRRGMSPADARYAALRCLGGINQTKVKSPIDRPKAAARVRRSACQWAPRPQPKYQLNAPGKLRMSTGSPSLTRSLALSLLTVWIASLFCFYFLEFRARLLVRTLGWPLTFLVIGSAYPILVAFPLSRLVSTRPRKNFVIAFCIVFMSALVLLGTIFMLVGGLVGAYGGGMFAIGFLGSAISYYLSPRSKFVWMGLLLACWVFVGDFAGYNLSNLLGGLGGIVAYASIYSVFLGSGIGALLWHTQTRREITRK